MMLFAGISALLNASEKADIIVAPDGTGDFTSIQDAVNSVPPDNNSLKIILIRKGSYEEKMRLDTDFIALVGEDRDGTRIHYFEPYVWDSVFVGIGRADYFQSEMDAIVTIETEHFTENVRIGDHKWTLTP